MKYSRYAAFAFVILFLSAVHGFAQGGCVDSPEAPTAVLLLIGSAGMIYGPAMLRRVFRR